MKIQYVSISPTTTAENQGCYSLTPELLAATGARYSRNNEGLDAIVSKIDFDYILNYRNSGDYYFYLQILSNVNYNYVPFALNYYRWHDTNTTKTNLNLNVSKEAFDIVFRFIKNNVNKELIDEKSLKKASIFNAVKYSRTVVSKLSLTSFLIFFCSLYKLKLFSFKDILLLFVLYVLEKLKFKWVFRIKRIILHGIEIG